LVDLLSDADYFGLNACSMFSSLLGAPSSRPDGRRLMSEQDGGLQAVLVPIALS